MRGDIIITEVENPGESTAFKVSGFVKGERRRQNFKTRAEALNQKQNWELENANMAPRLQVMFHGTEPQARECEAVLRRLAGHKLTLTGAVDFALANWRETAKQITTAKAIELYLAWKTTQNCRADSLRGLTGRLHLLKSSLGDRLVNELLPDALHPLIYRKDNSARTITNNRIVLFGFFKWCVKPQQGYCAVNPIAGIETPQLDETEPEALSLGDVRRLLNAALHYEDGKFIPYVVLGMFCAIRPKELARLSWADIDLTARAVTLRGKVAKMRGRRVVSISDNPAEFLLEHAPKKTPLVCGNWRKHFDALKLAAGFETWIPDGLRHTGISMHLAQHKDEGQTAQWAGNSPTVIHKHYKGLVKAADAKEFWNIRPADVDNIETVNFKKAA